MSDSLIILKNSSYAKGRKYIVDASEIMHNLRVILESAGTASVTEIIEATGQVYNPLVTTQLLNGITQLILAANYFKDIGTPNNIILDAYTPGYGVPTQYIHNMTVKFRPANRNTGATTLAFNGLSGVALLTDTYEPVSAGSLLPSIDYSATYNETLSAFILSSTIEDSGSLAMQEIRDLVESAGLTFSVALEQQLTQAVASYSLQQTYECVSEASDINVNNYVLKPINNFYQVPTYTNGMVIRFRPTYSNTLPNPTIQIYGMTKSPLVAADGDTIPAGSITNFFDVVVKYNNGSFYLVSNGLSSLKLQSGPVITAISDDTSLMNQSSSSVPTEYAVKSYVDAKANATKAYAVSSGKADNQGRADFLMVDADDSSVLHILAGTVGQPSYETMVALANAEASECKEPTEDPDEEGSYIYYTLANCFDGNNETYYETKKTGSDVAGQKDPMHEGEYLVMPDFVGATGLNRDISKVRFLANDPTTMPTSVFFQYSIDGGTTWQDVGTETYEELTPSGQIVTKVKRDIYYLDISSGQYTDVDVSIIPYADNTNPEYGVQYPYNVRCFAYEFTNATSGWQLTNYQFCYATEEIPPLVVTFADGTSNVTNDKSMLSVAGYDGVITVVENGGGAFELVNPGLYVESYVQPTPVDGLHWVKLGGSTIHTFLYTEDPDTGVIEESAVPFVKIGTAEVSSGAIIEVHPAAFNGEYTTSNLTLENPTTVLHNINSLNSAKFYITCVGADGGYVNGDTIELTTQAISFDFPNMISVATQVDGTSLTFAPITVDGVDYNISYSPDPHTHTATSTVTTNTSSIPAYRVVSSGLTTALLRYNTIVLPNKNTGSLFAINTNAWRLSVVCTRSF